MHWKLKQIIKARRHLHIKVNHYNTKGTKVHLQVWCGNDWISGHVAKILNMCYDVKSQEIVVEGRANEDKVEKLVRKLEQTLFLMDEPRGFRFSWEII